jgi:hypothetical protein
MKRIILLISIALLSTGLFAQSVLKTNLEIQKSAPVLYLNGTGATINWYNSDITLTQSSNTLTLAGGDFALGSNNITMTGSLGATGGRLLKGWMTNLEITNLPTINGGTFKTALSLTSSDVGLGNVTNESKATMFTSPTFTGVASFPTPFTLGAVSVTTNGTELNVLDNIPGTLTSTEIGYSDGVTSSIQGQLNGKLAIADTSTMLGPYALTTEVGAGFMVYPGSGIPLSTGSSWTTSITNNSANWNTAYSWGNWATAVGLRVAISDTANMLVPYIARADTATMLSHYAKITAVALKVNITDTATMMTNYAKKASPTFTGTVTFPTPFTLGATSVTANGAELNVLDNIPGTLTSTELGYSDGVTSAIQTQINAKLAIADSTTGAGRYASDHRADLIEAALADTVVFDTEELSDVAPLWGDTGTTITFPPSDTTATAVRGKVVFRTADSTIYVCRSILAPRKWYPLN